MFLVWDVQTIAEGKHKRCLGITTDDYILASKNLYMDVISLFLKVLEIVACSEAENSSNDNNDNSD
jgi:FtsH-binding integral membrane protein